MKNRKGLIFALCAMMGAATFMGCADDSGSGEDKGSFNVTAPSTTMNAGETQEITASYKPNTTIKSTSSDSDCIMVNESVSTGADNEAVISLSALGSDCSAKITVSANGTDESKSWNIMVSAAKDPYITLDSNKLIIEAGDKDTNHVTYKTADGSPAANKGLELTSSDKSCATVSDGIETNKQGEADIEVIAADVTDDCSATITVHPTAGGNDKDFTVKVKGNGGSKPVDDPVDDPIVTGTPKLEFIPNSLGLSPDDPTPKPITVSYYTEEDNKPISNAKVNITSSDPACVLFSASTTKTNSEGIVEGTVKPKGTNCTATLTASAGTVKAEITIAVSDKKNFDVRGIIVKANSKHDKMGFVSVQSANVSCADIGDDFSAYYDLDYAMAKSEADGIAPVVHEFDNDECKTEDCFKNISIDSNKSFVSIAYAGLQNQSKDDVVGYGCTDVSIADDGKVVNIELTPIPADLKGTYSVISNFDLLSGFKRGAIGEDGKLTCNPSDKTLNICVPKVEKMNAGDWIAFIIDFTKDPTMTLIEFVWSNALERLNDISDNKTYSEIVKTILSAKVLAVPMIKDYVDGFLETMDWYKLFKSIAADVNELATNMQLSGQFKVSEFNTLTFEGKALEKFTDLQYQWTSTESKSCLKADQTYNAGKCRENMSLDSTKKDNDKFKATMEGNWTGIVTDPAEVSSGDSDLDINSHALTFRWATILYRAVFGTILPKALGYEGTQSLKDEYYIKAMLEKVLFETVIKAYDKFLKENSLEDKSISTTDYTCENFITGLVDWVVFNKSKDKTTEKYDPKALENMNQLFKSAINTVGSFVCNNIEIDGKNYGLNGVDTLIIEQLDKIEAATTNGLSFSSKGCSLFDGNTTKYQKMGEADEGTIPSAHEIVEGSKKTHRCEWTITVPSGEGKEDVNLKGYFHATRTSDNFN